MSALNGNMENKGLHPEGLEDKAVGPMAAILPAPAPALADGLEVVIAHYNSSHPERTPGDVLTLPADEATSLISAGHARLA